MYPNFLSPNQALKRQEPHHEMKHHKEDKMMYQFSISAEKTPYRRSPTPMKNKDARYSASGAKIYKEDIVGTDLNNNLFSQDIADDENNKSPFSFLKRANPVMQMIQNTNKGREVFNNITNTINKQNIKEEVDPNIKIFERRILNGESLQ